MKLNQSQVTHIMTRLSTLAEESLSSFIRQLRDQIPGLLTERELLKWIHKVTDSGRTSESAVLLKDRPWPIEIKRQEKRRAAFSAIKEVEQEGQKLVEAKLSEIKTQLLFEDTWETGVYPQYLEDEVLDALVEFAEAVQS